MNSILVERLFPSFTLLLGWISVLLFIWVLFRRLHSRPSDIQPACVYLPLLSLICFIISDIYVVALLSVSFDSLWILVFGATIEIVKWLILLSVLTILYYFLGLFSVKGRELYHYILIVILIDAFLNYVHFVWVYSFG